MKRRSFLKYTGLAAGSLAVPAMLSGLFSPENNAADIKRLILVHLQGGNDGWNTLVPYKSKQYYQSRPSLAIESDELIHLSDTYGLNPALKELLPVYKSGNLLFLNSIGHSQHEFSHYEALNAWHSHVKGSGQSWLSPSPAAEDPELPLRFFNADQVGNSRKMLSEHAYTACSAGDFSEGLKRISDAIRSGSDDNVFHISLDGFDTHQLQKQRHQVLLGAYSSGVSKFISDLEAIGQMDNTMIFTYSEFGRSLQENRRRGTDHGNSNCAWMIGSRLKKSGILYPSPTELEATPILDITGLNFEIFRSWCHHVSGTGPVHNMGVV